MKRNILIGIVLLAISGFLVSKDNDQRSMYLNTFLVLPDFTYELYTVYGAGMGFDLKKNLSIQGAVFYWSSKSDYSPFINSIFSVTFDLKYQPCGKCFSPYMLLSQGIIVVSGSSYSYRVRGYSRMSKLLFNIGGGFGVEFRLNKRWSLFFETRVYLILFEDDVVRPGGFTPILTGIKYVF